jgi:Zn-dependent protease
MQMEPETIRRIIETLIILILSIAVHEFGHAYIADKLGDRLPRSQGRLTLNPLAHADPLGTLAFPIIGLILSGGHSIGFGYGRPVQVNPLSFSRRFRMRTGNLFVAAAGPAMNLIFGTLIAILQVVLIFSGTLSPAHPLSAALFHAVWLNYVLCFFNLIPFPPLDGGAVVAGLLPDRMVPQFEKIGVYGPFIVLGFFAIPQLATIFVTPARWLLDAVYGGLTALAGLVF